MMHPLTPGWRDVLNEYAARDKRIKVMFSEDNRWYSGSVKSRSRFATGEFIGLLELDDEITPDRFLK